jgi:methylthioribose-1-phosphate isomerase
MLLGKEKGISFHVFADETRPLLQGARLTSYELEKAGVDVTLICDNMASLVMKNGWVQACFVGCDRIAANGDFANKIGTFDKAIVAKRFGIPFYVAAPVSTFDFSTKTGKDIVIEQRSEEEMTMVKNIRIAPVGSKALNPAFDVTPAEFVTGFITEKGIFKPTEISEMKE